MPKIKIAELLPTLKQGLAPIYLVSGDEPYQSRESVASITRTAQDQGFSQTVKYHVEAGFDWSEVDAEAASISLFSEKKIIDIKLPTGKPGKEGGAAIKAFADSQKGGGCDTIMIIQAGKLEARLKKSAWYKAITQHGLHIEIWPLNLRDTERWLKKKLNQSGFSPTPDATRVLIDRVEGNMLAAVQEIEKIGLICKPGELDEAMVLDAVSDSARYDLYGFVDDLMQGNQQRAVVVLAGLREEGINENQIIWVIVDRLLKLTAYREAVATGGDQNAALGRLWGTQIQLIKSAARRLSVEELHSILSQAFRLDAIAKGRMEGNVWDELLQLCLHICGHRPLIIEMKPL